MNHLDPIQLNEFLDDALPVEERLAMVGHLQGCPTCQARLEELNAVFTSLAALPEAEPSAHLLPTLVSQFPAPAHRPAWRLVPAAQVVLALALLTVLLPSAGRLLKSISSLLPLILPPSIFTLPTFSLHLPAPETMLNLLRSMLAAPGSFFAGFSIGMPAAPYAPWDTLPGALNRVLSFMQFPPPPTLQVIVLAGAAGLVGLVGNIALLRRSLEMQK